MQVSLIESDCFGADWLAFLAPALVTTAPVALLAAALWMLARLRRR